MHKLKHKNGRDGRVFFYWDSNQKEVDVLVKQKGMITALEVKSAMTYNTSFEDTIKKLPT